MLTVNRDLFDGLILPLSLAAAAPTRDKETLYQITRYERNFADSFYRIRRIYRD
jgi:hypothetical protein